DRSFCPRKTELRTSSETDVLRQAVCSKGIADRLSGNCAAGTHKGLWPISEKEQPYRRRQCCEGDLAHSFRLSFRSPSTMWHLVLPRIPSHRAKDRGGVCHRASEEPDATAGWTPAAMPLSRHPRRSVFSSR